MAIEIHKVDSKSRLEQDTKSVRPVDYYHVGQSSGGPISAALAYNALVTAGYTIYSAHPVLTGCNLRDILVMSMNSDGDRSWWEFALTYDSTYTGPTAVPIDFAWDFSEASEAYFFDATGAPVQNSAKQPFESVPEKEVGTIKLTVTRNVPATGTGSINPAFFADYPVGFNNAMNQDSYTVNGVTVTAGQCRVAGGSLSGVTIKGGASYRVAKLILKFRASWLDTFADQGYYTYYSGTNSWQPICGNGQPNTQMLKPSPLHSGALASGGIPDVLTFQPYPATNFTTNLNPVTGGL